jgi:type IV secretory pathway TraG/TraD family ATPase VirD4
VQRGVKAIYLPFSEAPNHFMCLGATGSGKTLTTRLFMQCVLPSIGDGTDARAIVYDAKQDMLPLLHAMCPRARILTTNPFDARGVAWDLAADIREPRVAVETAFTLIPREHESQPFFMDASRHLLYGVIVSFMLSGHDWTFADLLRGVSSTKRLKAILKKHPQTRDIAHRYFGDRRLLSNIMSTLATKLLAFEPIAAAWEDAKEKVSLQQWAKEESILVLANSEISRTAIDAINRCKFKRATDITLGQSESFTRRNFFVVDETTEAPRFDGLVSLLKRGRSKGCSALLTMKSVAGLRDPKLYGPNFAAEILGQIGHKFIGRLECPETAEWVSKLFGDQEIEQITTSHTSSSNGNSRTKNQQIVTRRAVLPAELMDIDPCTRENGLTGYYMSRGAGCYMSTLPADELFDGALIPPDPNVPEFIERRVEAQYLRPWTDEEAAKFGAIVPKPEADNRPRKQANLDLLSGLDDLDGRPD